MNPQNSPSLVSGNPYLDGPHKNDVTFLWNGGSKPPPYKTQQKFWLSITERLREWRGVEDVAPYKYVDKRFNLRNRVIVGAADRRGEGFPEANEMSFGGSKVADPYNGGDAAYTSSVTASPRHLLPLEKARQHSKAFLIRKGIPKGKTCAEFCVGKIQTVCPLACFFASVSFHEKRNAKKIIS